MWWCATSQIDAMPTLRPINSQLSIPEYLRSDLVGAYREFFYITEERRVGTNAYDTTSPPGRLAPDLRMIITLNYDVALERALKNAGKWGYR